jgi:hypothetical protein
MAMWAAAMTSGGGSPSGNPWERLMALYLMEMRVISRMTDSVKRFKREAVCGILHSFDDIYPPLASPGSRRLGESIYTEITKKTKRSLRYLCFLFVKNPISSTLISRAP